ncbi:hypothetical protein KCP71_15510 [Salmonella enterica subsp. enterica]|nr:hypothetical protein KCP71_15510 [Salmonella enterica subsp. enterica]
MFLRCAGVPLRWMRRECCRAAGAVAASDFVVARMKVEYWQVRESVRL